MFRFCLLLSILTLAKACTTVICGQQASVDGSVLASHSSDGGGTLDPRLARIPSRNFPEKSMRPIYSSPENYPRYAGKDRESPEYYPENCQSTPEKCAAFTPIGSIPQVTHTYAYFESTYGIMNEHQVGIAESTCSGVFSTNGVDNGGVALLSIDQLSRIAMERASTSREAVSIMGSLAELYGFYGESDSFEGGAESLLVSDPSEGWIFHILPDPTGTSAIWVAERVPDKACAVVANMFVVREVNLSDTTNFLGSENMWEIAKEQGLWSESEPMDFTETFSDGEYSHKYYSGRRIWGAYRLLAPEIKLPAEYINLKDSRPYPSTVPISKPLTPADLFAVHRDWYKGTPYDPGEPGVLAGGAYGTPDRYGGGEGEQTVEGAWERTIALYRTSSSFVVQSRAWLPSEVGGVIWFGAYAPHGSCFVPIMPGSMIESPKPLSHVYQGVLDRKTNFWAHRLVFNLAQVKFSYMITDIQSVQKTLESESQELVDNISNKYRYADFTLESTNREISELLADNVIKVRDSFLELFDSLMFKYADGWINSWTDNGFTAKNTGYPAWWLEKVGYAKGPGPVAEPLHSTMSEAPDSAENCLSKCLQMSRNTQENEVKLKQCAACCLKDSFECHR